MEPRNELWLCIALALGVAGCAADPAGNDSAKALCPPPCATGSGGASASGSGGMIGAVASGGHAAFGSAGNANANQGSGGSPLGSGGAPVMQGTAGLSTGSGGMSAATGGTSGGSGGMTGGSAGAPTPGGDCGTVPAVTDYAATGPFADTTMMDGSGPDGMFTIIKPTTLGENGFKHPIITWGNGITTTPQTYPGLLSGIASHGFVIIASDNSNVTSQLMVDGLDWLIKQNDAGGMFEGKLNVKCAATVGYSLGGGAAVGAGSHENVRATVSFHGLQGAAGMVKGPLLLFTTTADGFVTKDNYVKPCYDASTTMPTIMATMEIPGYESASGATSPSADFAGHLYPVGDAGDERAPAIAWLRWWIYGDEGAKKYFYGDDCILCKSPWIDIQRKNGTW